MAEVSALADERPPAPGADGVVQVVLTGGPDGDISYHWTYMDGRPGDGRSGPAEEPDLVLTLPASDAWAVIARELDPSVAFMQGRLKTSGDDGLLLAVLASATSESFAAWWEGLAGKTSPRARPSI